VVEFALSLPLVLLCVFVFLDLGRAVYYFSAVSNAVREGARYAIVHKMDVDEEAAVRSIVANYSVAVPIDPATVTIQIGGDEGQYITIAASYEFNPVTPYLELILGSGNTISIHSSSTMLLAPIAR
jgi:Flp pilus assembly protein TadG